MTTKRTAAQSLWSPPGHLLGKDSSLVLALRLGLLIGSDWRYSWLVWEYQTISRPKIFLLKIYLINKLLDSLAPQLVINDSSCVITPTTTIIHLHLLVLCCDVLTDNGPVLVESSVCLNWSHVACYGIAPTAAKKSKFKCTFCINDSSQHLISLTNNWQIWTTKILHYRLNYPVILKACNSKFISVNDANIKSCLQQIELELSNISTSIVFR